MLAYVCLMHGADGEAQIHGTIIDITERKDAVEALQRSRQRYEELVNSIDGIVWEGDPDTGRTTFVSRQAERLLGFTPEQWRADPAFLTDRLHPRRSGLGDRGHARPRRPATNAPTSNIA